MRLSVYEPSLLKVTSNESSPTAAVNACCNSPKSEPSYSTLPSSATTVTSTTLLSSLKKPHSTDASATMRAAS